MRWLASIACSKHNNTSYGENPNRDSAKLVAHILKHTRDHKITFRKKLVLNRQNVSISTYQTEIVNEKVFFNVTETKYDLHCHEEF